MELGLLGGRRANLNLVLGRKGPLPLLITRLLGGGQSHLDLHRSGPIHSLPVAADIMRPKNMEHLLS